MPSWSDLKRFCERDGWEMYKRIDHWYYQKLLPDGTLKRTKVLMGTGEIRNRQWKEIRKKQLQVTQEYFKDLS
jgi:hypothetical protein